MGFGGQLAQQQSEAAHVRFGSKADIGASLHDVRFTPESRHQLAELRCPLQLDVLPVALIQQIIGEGGILMCGIGQFRIAR